MSAYDPRNYVSFKTGDTVRAFDPRTLGVVKTGRVIKIGRSYVTVDFGLTGWARVTFADILENVTGIDRPAGFEFLNDLARDAQ